MKKRIWVLALITICAAIAAKGTVAYFKSEGTATNVITSNGVEVTLLEQQMEEGKLQPAPGGVLAVNPGTKVSKIVSVRNEDAESWVRMRWEVSFFDAQGTEMPLTEMELSELISIDTDTQHWAFRDGWWYYQVSLPEGESSKPLFETVKFSGSMGNAYQNSTAELQVFVQAVQTANNGASVWEAAGWPES